MFVVVNYLVCTSVLPVGMYVHHVCAGCLRRPEEGIELPGTGVRPLRAAIWVLRTEARSSARALSLQLLEEIFES